ncbi:MAG: DUF2933 domain-containing protein [Candidatus Woesebacteria bacterium]
MKTFGKILLYGVGVVTLYSILVTFTHMPAFGIGSFFFPLLLLCPLMYLFMDHGGHSEKKKSGHTH